MRVFRQIITGTIDSTGNASIVVKLPTTGEWHELKVAASTAGPSEWAIVVSGTAVTYGRGRRVTLGPELIQDGETVTVTVTGGPIGQAILGTITGKSGTPDEILLAWAPQPNTIALDAVTPRQKLFPDGTAVPASALTPSYTVAGAATVTNRFTLPTGTVAVRILATASGLVFTYSLLVTGHQTAEQYWGSTTAPGSPAPVPTATLPFTIPVENDWDSQLDFTLHNTSANQMSVFVSALFAAEAPGQAGAAQSVISPTPAPWQAAQAGVAFLQSIAAGGVFTLVSALAGAVVYLHHYSIAVTLAAANINLEDLGGAPVYHTISDAVGNVPQGPYEVEMHGLPTAPGGGIRLRNTGGATVTCWGGLYYTQA